MQKSTKISSHFGIAIRKGALVEKGLNLQKIIESFEMESPLDESADLVTFGPHFGLDHAEVRGKLLEKIGLEYIDDFFYFYGDFPEWAEFSVSLK